MNNLEKYFYCFLKNLILLHKNTHLWKQREWEQNVTEYLRMVSVNAAIVKNLFLQ